MRSEGLRLALAVDTERLDGVRQEDARRVQQGGRAADTSARSSGRDHRVGGPVPTHVVSLMVVLATCVELQMLFSLRARVS